MRPSIWVPCGPGKLTHEINHHRKSRSGFRWVILLSLEDHPDFEATQNHASIDNFFLDLTQDGGQFGMRLNGLARYCHTLQFGLLSGP